MLKNKSAISKNELIYHCKIEKARRDFYSYCRVMHKEFYKKDRIYLKFICDKLQHFYFNDDKEILVINLPP